MNIERIDLNLLKVLIAIFEERKITVAAERLGLTQPGVSHALGRLREQHRDELFIRTANGMMPTAFANDLYARIRPAFDDLRAGLTTEDHTDFHSLKRDVTLGMNDYGTQVILPSLIKYVTKASPHVRIRTRHYAHGSQMDDLRSGAIDLSITISGNLPGWVNASPLFTETAVVIADSSNPAIRKSLTPKIYTECPHVVMAASGEDRTWVDEVLANHGMERTVQHTVPHFLALPSVILGTLMLGTVPHRIAETMANDSNISIYPFPFKQKPHQIVQCWSRRQGPDPTHTWLRSTIADVCKNLA